MEFSFDILSYMLGFFVGVTSVVLCCIIGNYLGNL